MNSSPQYNISTLNEVPLPVAEDGSIRVWFAFRELLFTTQANGCYYQYRVGEGESLSRAKIITFLETYNSVAVLSDNPLATFEEFAHQMVWVEAAGGVVENEQQQVVMIRRNSRWDLPKGHREQGESFSLTAAREAEEETGVKVDSVGELLATTLHSYNLYGRWELKLTAWYAMRGEGELTPQAEEGIICAEWIDREQIAERIKSSFPTIKRVFSAFLK